MTRSYPEIDGLRGVLSLIVVVGHITAIIPWPQVLPETISPMFWYWGSMEIFFCISGYLITRGLFQAMQTRRDWITQYLIKRALRIWPAYYAALIVAILVSLYLAPHSAPKPLTWNGDLAYLLQSALFLQYTELYLGDTLSSGAVPTFAHSWSVALEEQFYIGILLLLMLRQRSGLFPGYRLAAPLLALLPLSALARHFDFSALTLLGRAEGFLLGIVLACVAPAFGSGLDDRSKRRISVALLLFPLPLLAPYLLAHGDWSAIPVALRTGVFNPHFAFATLGFGLLASIILAPITWVHGLLRLRFLQGLGTVSYSTYLFHVPVLLVAKRFVDEFSIDNAWLYAIVPPAVLATSLVTYRFIERPFLLIKQRLGGRQAASPSVALPHPSPN